MEEETDSEEQPELGSWNLSWSSSRFKPSTYSGVGPNQKVNHFPKTSMITRKDSLLRALRKMRVVHGSIYNFFPDAFLLPTEYTKFVEDYSAQGETGVGLPAHAAPASSHYCHTPEQKSIWIMKPTDSSRGRNIYLMRELSDLVYGQPYLAQKVAHRSLYAKCLMPSV